MNLYQDIWKYYDIIYSQKDYRKEADCVIALIQRHNKTDCKKLLDIGCGTGSHDIFFQRDFEIYGIDLSTDVLKIAEQRIPDGKFFKADMRDFDLHEKFGSVGSLFGVMNFNFIVA